MITFQILFILGWVLHDWYVENKQSRTPNHGQNFVLRIIMGFWVTLFICGFKHLPLLGNMLFSITTFAFFFPVGLNIARGKPWAYLGDSDFDKWVVKWCNPLIWYGILAMAAMAGIAAKIYGIQVLWTGH